MTDSYNICILYTLENVMHFSKIKNRIKRMWYKTPILIKGPAGIGKTKFCESLANELGLELVKLDCAQSGDAGDMIGLLEIENHVHKHTRPSWMDPDKKVLVFIDELNRAKPEVIAALMQLCSPEQGFNGYYLAPGSRVIVAINPSDIAANDCPPLPRPLYTRFWRFDAEVDVELWCDWAESENLNKLIINFIKSNEGYLHREDENVENESEDTVNPRSWENFARMFDNSYNSGDYTNQFGYLTEEGIDLIRSDATGCLGSDMAITFSEWIEKNGDILDDDKIANATEHDWHKIEKIIEHMGPSEFVRLNDNLNLKYKSLVEKKKLTKEQSLNFNRYFFTIKREIRAQIWSSYFKSMMSKGFQGVKWLRNVFDFIGKDLEDVFKTELENCANSKDIMLQVNKTLDNIATHANQTEVSTDQYEGLLT